MSAPRTAASPSLTNSAKAVRNRQNRELPPEYEGLIACLEEAGATMLSLPTTGFSPALKTAALPILRDAAEAYGWSAAEVRPFLRTDTCCAGSSDVALWSIQSGAGIFLPGDAWPRC